MNSPELDSILTELDQSISLSAGAVTVGDESKLRRTAHRLAEISALESGERQAAARYLTRAAALALGIYPASIHELYVARGRGDVPADFTVPAMNLRTLSYDAASAVFRVAQGMDAGAMLFEIARSEIGYTGQRPAEYATNILAAAISEGYRGPVFIQGDHFQVSRKRYVQDAEEELDTLRALMGEAVQAGFFNIDVDTSTLVDLSKDTIAAQQELNADLSAMFTAYIRSIEPQGVTISVGGEIGEVGGVNSNEEELRAYMDSYSRFLEGRAAGSIGLSKISIQTGTSHGGVLLPDGSLAQVSIDFDTLQQLSQIARQDYQLAGAVQHGASTLPQEAFGKFSESEACEVHLATNFQNMLYDRLPEELRAQVYAYLDEHHSDERKPEQTDQQFYYKTRKRAIGPFKAQMWGMAAATKSEISAAWEKQFKLLFTLLNVGGTRKYVDEHVTRVDVPASMEDYRTGKVHSEDTSDLAD
ncbi:MAG: class II fructose-bisphosphate aldolase [Chloroflexi bacterium]|nr:class II fructose-bisphosphate aldolase [Chloroflexota bacterium]